MELNYWIQIDAVNQFTTWPTAFLLAVRLKQRSKPAVVQICRTKPMTQSGQGAQLAVWPDLDRHHQAMLAMEHIPFPGRRADSQPSF